MLDNITILFENRNNLGHVDACSAAVKSMLESRVIRKSKIQRLDPEAVIESMEANYEVYWDTIDGVECLVALCDPDQFAFK